jgi:hypothetical protein
MGARWAATYGRFVGAEGVTDYFAATDFFGEPLRGSETAFYNLGGRGAAVATPQGVVMIVPAGLDPVGFRPTAFDSGNGLVDVVGLGGPFGYVPADGTSAGLLDWQTLALLHRPFEDQAFTVDGVAQEGQQLPSGIVPLFGSPTYPLIVPMPEVRWGFSVDGRELIYDPLAPTGVAQDAFLFETGIPSYGTYCLIDVAWHVQEPMTWSDGTPITQADVDYLLANLPEDVTRAMGTYCWVVTETPGLLGSPGYEAWWSSAPGGPAAPFDPVDEQVAALLSEIGLVRGPDGEWTFEPPDVVTPSD